MSNIKQAFAEIVDLSNDGWSVGEIATHLNYTQSFVIEVLMSDCELDSEYDQFRTDAEADADALASVGWGTDEDYGCFSDEMEF